MAIRRDESLSQMLMLVCMASALLLVAWQWKQSPPAIVPPAKAVPTQAPKPQLQPKVAPIATQPAGTIQSQSKLVVDLSDRRVYLYEQNQLTVNYPIAVGKSGWETPTGEFRVMQMRRDPVWRHPITRVVVSKGSDNPLGARWIGFWSDGRNLIGFHGTNEENLVGQAVSHGCLRMRNQDIIALYEKVDKGTPVVVRQ